LAPPTKKCPMECSKVLLLKNDFGEQSICNSGKVIIVRAERGAGPTSARALRSTGRVVVGGAAAAVACEEGRCF
jgi:hypothetical protein